MLNYFNVAKKKIMETGEQVNSTSWKTRSCTYEVSEGGISERISAPGLVNIIKTGNDINIVEGSKDALKFLAVSI